MSEPAKDQTKEESLGERLIDSKSLFEMFKGQIHSLLPLRDKSNLNETQKKAIGSFISQVPVYMKNLGFLKAKVINEFAEKDYLLLFTLYRIQNAHFISDFSEIIYRFSIDPAFIGKLMAMEGTPSLISTIIEIINNLLEVLIELEKTELSTKLLFVLDLVFTNGSKLLKEADTNALFKVAQFLSQSRFCFDYISKHKTEKEEAVAIASNYSSFYNLLVTDHAKYIGLFAKVFEEKQSNELLYYLLYTVFFPLWSHLKKNYFENQNLKPGDFSCVIATVFLYPIQITFE